jgi:hypothetical protein
MDHHHHDGQSLPPETGPTASRRKFLRQVGMTAAAAAAGVGAADVFGVRSAHAAPKQGTHGRPTMKLSEGPPALVKRVREIRSARPDEGIPVCCSPAPGNCGRPCHPNGVWCHICCSISCWYSCIEGHTAFCYSP